MCRQYDKFSPIQFILGWTRHVSTTLQPLMCPPVVESMDEGGPHWILGVSHGKGEYLVQNHFHPLPWWWFKAHMKWENIPIGPVRCSFCKFHQTLLPIWSLCGTWCWSCCCLHLELAFSKISWTYCEMWWIYSMNLVSLMSFVQEWEESNCVDARGRATSMGPNGRNPKPTWNESWLVELWRYLL